MDLLDRLRSFRSNQRGAVAVIAALSMLPIFALTGAALDYSRASDSRSRLNSAADAAALAALKAKPSDDPEDIGRKVFHGNVEAARLTGVDITYLRVTVDNKRSKSTVTYEAKVKTTIAALIQDHTPIGGTAEATLGNDLLRDIYFVVDNSVSMSFPIDMDNNRIPVDSGGCIFSCHITRNDTRVQGIVTRLDSGIAAFKALSGRLAENCSEALLSLFTSSRTLRQELNQTSSKTQFDQKIDEIGYDNSTHMAEQMSDIADIVSRASRNRDRIVILLTDGLEEHRNTDYAPPPPADPNGDPTWVGAFDGVGRSTPGLGFPSGTPAPMGFVDACDRLKRSGSTVFVIYTPNFGGYPSYDRGHQENEPASRAALERCASPGNFINVTSQSTMDRGVETIVSNLSKLRVSK